MALTTAAEQMEVRHIPALKLICNHQKFPGVYTLLFSTTGL